MAMVLVIIEMILDVRKRSKKEKLPFFRELWNELAFYFKFKQSVKPVKRRASLCSINSKLIDLEDNVKTKEGSHVSQH